MVKSMFAAVAGLRTHQSKMDVIGNNIANVNTWGYKSASMSFKDTMYSSTSSGSGGSTQDGSYGGTNSNQVGYGVTTGAISYNFSTGGMSPSSRSTDCMINGSGFFIVGPMKTDGVSLDSDGALESSGLKLSRVGKFEVDENGYLVDDSGNYVYGFQNTSPDITKGDTFGTSILKPLKIPTTSAVAAVKSNQASDYVSSTKTKYDEAVAALNTAQGALAAAEQSYILAKNDYDAAYNATTYTSASGTSDIAGLKKDYEDAETARNNAYDAWQAGTGTEANYHTVNLDYEHKKYLYKRAYTNVCQETPNTTALDSAWNAFNDAYTGHYITPGTPGTYTKQQVDDALTALTAAENAVSSTQDNSLLSKMNAAKLAVTKADKAVDDAKIAVTKAKNDWTQAQEAAASTSSSTTADDKLASMTSYKIQEDGTLTGVASAGKGSGTTIVLGKIALAGVQNPSGLEKDSGYYYSIGANAGNVGVYEAGGSEGKIKSNYLEMATVDLATEMSDMITTQRGFQANSKIITVTDTMLEELVNMKR